MANYFDMGGYAGYVWPSYAVAAIVLVALFVATWRGLKTRERTLEMLQAARGPRRRRAAGAESPTAAVKEETSP
ncbi:heme exporter protein CcmD [Novispirillum sp. DQ9]|uniref:heme exporter protein CcmD n=1 Tax=Novispirillum sp. DQ9 TaxID=3398612 RepID=UPI003C797582